MKFGIVVFPGSNCDQDCLSVIQNVFQCPVQTIWHKETTLPHVDVVILPGGFSYGDYLRPGAIAKVSPIMPAIVSFANKGGPVLGICNGFQILIEAGLLPGALMRNKGLKFLCQDVFLRLMNTGTPFTRKGSRTSGYAMPIAHMEGNYFIDSVGLKRLQDKGQVVFQYIDSQGRVTDLGNPNGSVFGIAGICNEKGNVLGLMPHPERVCESVLGGVDGKFIFESLL